MSYLVVGKRDGDGWALDVRGVGSTRTSDLAGAEDAVRALLTAEGYEGVAEADLQLLLPDFEVDLSEERIPRHRQPKFALLSGIILLIVVAGGAGFALSRLI